MSQMEATVEVLTAEVRTLMVGSRQVTMSVFNQLDTVKYPQGIEPFGRVRSKDYGLWIVGKSLKTGALVRAGVQEPVKGQVWDGPPSWKHWIRHAGWRWSQSGYIVAEFEDSKVAWNFPTTLDCPVSCSLTDEEVIGLEVDWRDRAEAELHQVVQTRRRWEEAKGLPLIVLAGLR